MLRIINHGGALMINIHIQGLDLYINKKVIRDLVAIASYWN